MVSYVFSGWTESVGTDGQFSRRVRATHGAAAGANLSVIAENRLEQFQPVRLLACRLSNRGSQLPDQQQRNENVSRTLLGQRQLRLRTETPTLDWRIDGSPSARSSRFDQILQGKDHQRSPTAAPGHRRHGSLRHCENPRTPGRCSQL